MNAISKSKINQSKSNGAQRVTWNANTRKTSDERRDDKTTNKKLIYIWNIWIAISSGASFVALWMTFFYFIHFSADKYYALISTNQSTVGWRNVVFHLTSQRIRRTTESWYLICVHLQGIETTTNETNVKRLELNKDRRLRHSGVRFLFVFFSRFSRLKSTISAFVSFSCLDVAISASLPSFEWSERTPKETEEISSLSAWFNGVISFRLLRVHSSFNFCAFVSVELRAFFSHPLFICSSEDRGKRKKKREKRRRTDLKNNTVKHLTNNFVRVWRMFDNCKRNTIKSSEKRLN